MSFSKLESFIFEQISDTKLPGLSAAAVKGDDVVWSKGFGYRDLDVGLATTPHTLCSVGSVTKSFTALAIMQLVEQGKLKLDDPVEDYLPFEIRPGGAKVRVWHLLCHASGIPALAYAENMIGGVIGARESWLPIASYSDLLTFMKDAQDWTLTKPGERWFYLNEGYVLLSCLIEKFSGMSYADYVTQNILKPLGMDRSFFHKQDVQQDQDAAVPYVTNQNGDRIPSRYPYGLTGDGGLISNVLDLAKYISMYLNWGKAGDVQIISKESLEDMQNPRVVTPGQGGPFGDYRYAFGLGTVDNFYGNKLVGHSGSVGVATGYVGFIPEKGIGVAILANGSGYSLPQFGQYGLASMLGEDPDKLPFILREKLMSELEGVYETYKGTTAVRVKKMGDFLMVESKNKYGTQTTPLVPENIEGERRTFFTLAGGTKLTVEFRVQGDQVGYIQERYYFKKTGKLT